MSQAATLKNVTPAAAASLEAIAARFKPGPEPAGIPGVPEPALIEQPGAPPIPIVSTGTLEAAEPIDTVSSVTKSNSPVTTLIGVAEHNPDSRTPQPSAMAPTSAPPAAPATHDELLAVENALGSARMAARQSLDALRRARSDVGKALERFNALTPRDTPEDAARQFIADGERALRAAGQLPPRPQNRPGPSRIDAIAAGTAGATYGARGGVFAYKRGAVSLAEATKQNNLRAAAKAAAEG